MLFLDHFCLPSEDDEFDFFMSQKRQCYETYYPFKVLSQNGFFRLDFEPVTILYGGNGSGKTTALNVIGNHIHANRGTAYNRSNFFEDYVSLCSAAWTEAYPAHVEILTSDDVFDFMHTLRTVNENIDEQRENLFETYLDAKYSSFKMNSMADYDRLKQVNASRRKTQSKFVKSQLMANVRTHSNGESAFRFFDEKIKDNGLYLLDEPENSLSPKNQMKLLKRIEEAARYFGCQFILSTHSPFLLAIKGAKIYDLDANPVDVKKWTQLSEVRATYAFFMQHQSDFYKD